MKTQEEIFALIRTAIDAARNAGWSDDDAQRHAADTLMQFDPTISPVLAKALAREQIISTSRIAA